MLGLEIGQAQAVVIDPSLLDIVEIGRHTAHAALAEPMGEMLPEIEGMGMLAPLRRRRAAKKPR